MKLYRMQNEILVPISRVEREEKEKLSRYATLTVGMYAWQNGQIHDCNNAGSGVFVAPGLVLGAKHVVNDMGTMDPRWKRDEHEENDFEDPDFDIRIYQAPRLKQPVLWYVKGSVSRSKDTDIAIVPVEPESRMAKWAAERALRGALVPWRLEPPPVGETVELYGYPKSFVRNDGDIHSGRIQWKQQHGVVTDVFPKMRTHGHVDFPSFRIDRPVESGFSGGPVFYRGALVGITSIGTEVKEGEDLIGDTYIASLWPLILLDFEYRGEKVTFGDLFKARIIEAIDYDKFCGKVERTPCDRCQMDNPKHGGHAEWVEAL